MRKEVDKDKNHIVANKITRIQLSFVFFVRRGNENNFILCLVSESHKNKLVEMKLCAIELQ